MSSIRRYFINGLLFILPIGVTIWFLYFAVTKVDKILYSVLSVFMRESAILDEEKYVFGFSILLTFALLLVIGWLVTDFFGRIITRWVDRLFDSVPLVNKVYSFIKQITTSFSASGGGAFKRTVLVDYPHPGMKAVGFVSNELKDGLSGEERTKGKLAVFVPTSPNPTSGFVMLVDESDVIPLDMSVEEGLKFIVSGGALQVDGDDGNSL